METETAIRAQQWLVFLIMALAFTGGFLFLAPWRREKQPLPKDPRPLTRAERQAGASFVPSFLYRHYRNPMKVLRRFCGWPSGRQWVKLRKFWNRETPDGARRFAQVVVSHHA